MEVNTHTGSTHDILSDEQKRIRAARKAIVIQEVLARMRALDPATARRCRDGVALKLGIMSDVLDGQTVPAEATQG